MEKKPLPADETTKVISQSAINAAVKAQVKPPFGGVKPKTTSPQKKRIVPGLLTAGGLLAGGIALSSFQIAPDTEEPVEGDEAAGKMPAVISTSHPVSEVVADDLSFEEARDLAREEVGHKGLFTYKGVVNVTTTEAEMDQMTASEKEAFMQDVVVEHNQVGGTEVDINGQLMQIEFPLMDRYLEVLTDEDGNAYTRDINGTVNLLENVSKDPFTNQLIRTDIETGEVTQFNPTAILQNVDEGRVDVSIYPSDVEITDNGEILVPGGSTAESMVSFGWMIDEAGEWGYDYDGDGVIDLYEHELYATTDDEPAVTNTNAVETPRSDSDLLEERIQEIADEAGIDDVTKIKIKDTEDGWDIKIKGDDGEKVKMHVTKEELGATGIEGDGGIDDFKKIKITETEDGWDVKAKTEDGETIKTHISNEDAGDAVAADDFANDNTSLDSYEDFNVNDTNTDQT